jgi:seryl-tRNA(Sec) selenium transferase
MKPLPVNARRALRLVRVCELAAAHDVPVIVDAAAELPPSSNLVAGGTVFDRL